MPEKIFTFKTGARLIKFDPSPNMPSYLLAFAIGEFEYIEKRALGTNFRVITTIGLSSQGNFAIDVAIKCTELLNKFFAMNYDLPKMDLIAIPDFRGGAMEVFLLF